MSTSEHYDQMRKCLDNYLETGNELLLRQALDIGHDLYRDGNDDAGYLLAMCYTVAAFDSQEFGSIEQAIAIYKKLIDNHYENNYVVLQLGKLYENTEQSYSAFECYKRYHELEPDDETGAFYLAKSYKNGVGTNVNLETAKKLFDSINSGNLAKNNEFFAEEYGELLEKIGLYKEANRWYELAFSLTDDTLAKINYAKDIITLQLHHNIYRCSTASSIIKCIESYIEKIEEIDRQSKESPDYSNIHEIYLLVKNEINIFLAEHADSKVGTSSNGSANIKLLPDARNALYNKNYQAALQFYKNIISVTPKNIEAIILCGLLENDDGTIENYSLKLNNIKRAIADNNIVSLKSSIPLVDVKNVCVNIATTTIYCVDTIYTVLNDTFKLLTASHSTYQRLSPVGFSRNIYYPVLYEIGKTLYKLGDAFERVFSRDAIIASCNLWKMGNVYMSAYMNNLGFLKKQEIKAVIHQYTSKIK